MAYSEKLSDIIVLETLLRLSRFSITFLDYLSCHIFVILILCPFDVLSVNVLSVSHQTAPRVAV